MYTTSFLQTLTHGYTEWFIPNYKRVVVSVLVSCVQSNKYNQPQLVEAVEFDTAERESLSPTIVDISRISGYSVIVGCTEHWVLEFDLKEVSFTLYANEPRLGFKPSTLRKDGCTFMKKLHEKAGAEKNEETEAGTTGVLSLSDIIYRSEANSEVHMICRDPKEKNILIVTRKWRLIFTPPCQVMEYEIKNRMVCVIPSNIRCETFIPNTPPRDNDSLSVNLGMFGQGSMGRIWTGSIMDRTGLYGSDSDTMLS
ncbi:hypothetical protein YC2023_034357 [Brassica napus]